LDDDARRHFPRRRNHGNPRLFQSHGSAMMNRYIVKPNEHGYQVFDTTREVFCLHSWSSVKATAQEWADKLNIIYEGFKLWRTTAVELINKECTQ
jgi:hypothetical protein